MLCCVVFFFFQMHENKYLHLPVVDVDASTVVGVVNVMEILQATAGDKGSARYYYTLYSYVVLRYGPLQQTLSI